MGMNHRWIYIISSIVLFACLSISKELPLVLDKQGTFKMLSRTDFTLPNCGFTKAEMTENLKELTTLVEVMRKNPVLEELKGFEGNARIYNVTCNDPDRYGVPSRISFEFCSWFQNKNGIPVYNAIEPPEWSIIINKQRVHSGANFEPDKTYFTVPSKKETIVPGIDVYDGERYVVYNPDRPPYWLPLTVGEAFNKMKAYWSSPSNTNDKFTAEQFLKMIEAEYAATPKSDMNKLAHNKGDVGATADDNWPLIVRANPDYWNKSLPKSAIQILSFTMINNRKFLENRRKEALEKNSISYQVYRFEESLNLDTVRALLPIIRK
jgi:hypothetical protein